MSESESFTCEACGGTFTKTRSDAEAEREARDIFGVDSRRGKMAVVCDVCLDKLIVSWGALCPYRDECVSTGCGNLGQHHCPYCGAMVLGGVDPAIFCEVENVQPNQQEQSP